MEIQIPNLTDEERIKILAVLERGIALSNVKEGKTNRLKSELSWLRRKGAVKVWQEDGGQRSCGRCQTELGLIINRGALCPSCRQRVCKDCRKYPSFCKDWVCIVCNKQVEIQLNSGEWINEFVRRPSRRRDKYYVAPAESARKTLIRRSWSISSPATSNLDVREERPQKSQPPQKPPRKSLEENVLLWERKTSKPSRRYSMSSFDGLSAKARVHKVPPTNQLLPRNLSFEDRNRNLPARESVPGSPNCKAMHRHYYFGNDPFPQCQRPSTLPRPPAKLDRPQSMNLMDHDRNGFHSVPRTKAVRRSAGEQISGGRVGAGPPPFYVSPVRQSTSLHYVHSLSSPRKDQPQNRGVEPPNNPGRTESGGQSWAFTGRGEPYEERGTRAVQIRKLEIKDNVVPVCGKHSLDSGVSEPSIGPSPDASDEGESSPLPEKHRIKTLFLRTSNASVASDSACRYGSRSNVRRCNSFQMRPPKSLVEDDFGGHVANFVKNIEKRIRSQTSVSEKPKRSSKSFREYRHSSSFGEDSNFNWISGRPRGVFLAPEENPQEIFDVRRTIPVSDDYKLVFISSDSSVGSDFNSFDSDNSLRMNEECRGSQAVRQTKDVVEETKGIGKSFVDASVNTEWNYSSEESSSNSSSDDCSSSPTLPPKPTDKPRSSYSSGIDANYLNDEKFPHSSGPSQRPCSTDLLKPKDLELMLRQTKVVQAEALALQNALIGSFNSEGKSSSSWKRNEELGKPPHYTVANGAGVQKGKPTDANDNTQHIYENIDRFSAKPQNAIKYFKSVCIQTDLELTSSDEGDSHETSSDVSSNSAENVYPSRLNGVSKTPFPQCVAQPNCNSSTQFGQVIKEQFEPIKTKGQDSVFSAPSSCLLGYPPLSLALRNDPPSHLHSTSDCDSRSVSLSSECESLRGQFDVIRGHSRVVLKPKSNHNVSANQSGSCENECALANEGPLRSESEFKNKFPNLGLERARSNNNDWSSLPPENYPREVKEGHPLRSFSESLKPKRRNLVKAAERMSYSERKADESTSDINATQESIPHHPIFSNTDLTSSGTSEEDTDDDVHVSRSYNVSKVSSSEHSDEAEATDSDKTKSEKSPGSGDSEDENVRNGHLLESLDHENEKSKRETVMSMNDDSVAKADAIKGNGTKNQANEECLRNTLLENVEKTELPECDQAMEVGGSRDENVSSPADNEGSEKGENEGSEKGENELTDSLTENKSETESTLGLDMDQVEALQCQKMAVGEKESLCNENCKEAENSEIIRREKEREATMREREESERQESKERAPQNLESKFETLAKIQESENCNDLEPINDGAANSTPDETKYKDPIENEGVDSDANVSDHSTAEARESNESNSEFSCTNKAVDTADRAADLCAATTEFHDRSRNKNGSNASLEAGGGGEVEGIVLTSEERRMEGKNKKEECSASQITGSVEVERGSDSRAEEEAVTLGKLSEEADQFAKLDSHETIQPLNLSEGPPTDESCDCDVANTEGDNKSNCELNEKVFCSESGHSSGGESEIGSNESLSVVKISVTENNDEENSKQTREDNAEEGMLLPPEEHVKDLVDTKELLNRRLKSGPEFSKTFSPSAALRKAKRSWSSDCPSSSSDVERSDASDSADATLEGKRLQAKVELSFKPNKISDELNRDSDGPSSADSLLLGADSESQCSDGSEEGNLVTIVAVGEETLPQPSSQGKIYIRSETTDSDVQIKPTCIVVTGSSEIQSGKDGPAEGRSRKKKNSDADDDVTILEVTSVHRKDHVMSVRVTSPDSSLSTSPTIKSNVSELQSMILTHRERQQQFRPSHAEPNEASSLSNYFTVTLGTDSPITPRRSNKTPEVRRRKITDRDQNDSSSSTPTLNTTPSPSHTPSPTVTPTPDHSEGDLLAYEEHHVGIMGDPFSREQIIANPEAYDVYYDENFVSYIEGSKNETDAAFDFIEDAESNGESNLSETSSEDGIEREEELRGYCKRGYDFTLHTIIEESCEESDYEKKFHKEARTKRDQSELEKYFYFGLGNGPADAKKYANEESEYSDTFSETSSSIFSEGMESMDGTYDKDIDPEELASSRLEKYFSGFLGFERQPSIRSVGEDSETHTDESGSVGSDSEGSPSPEQPRKKLFRSRGVRSVSSNRSHGYSSDKGEGVFSDGSLHSGEGEEEKILVSGEDEGSTESEETAFDKGDGQFDTIKRRKKKKLLSEADKKPESELKNVVGESKAEDHSRKIDHNKEWYEYGSPLRKTLIDDLRFSSDKTEKLVGDLAERKYQSRDSGFIGSSDDLLKDKPEDVLIKESENRDKAVNDTVLVDLKTKKIIENKAEKETEVNKQKTQVENDTNNNKSENEERSSNEGKVSRSSTGSSADLPLYSETKSSHNLSRKDSFNNWSSDEETNIMMNKMRIFFKNMFSSIWKDAQKGQKIKSPQLVMFEAKLSNLMRTVPGINDDQVKEIVEYLSSEETWSDSYDSSDYTSSDLEGPYARLLEGPYARLDRNDPEMKSELQEQISASCQQIIKNFDQSREPSDMDAARSFFGNRMYTQSSEDPLLFSKDTAFVYQKLISSISHMKPDSDRGSVGSSSQGASPPLLTKVIHHIGDRIVALMHEVSAGSDAADDADSFNDGNPVTSSPRQTLFLRKKYASADAISFDSSVDKSSLTNTSFDSEDSPTDTEQSPESETGTPKIFKRQKLSIISEKSTEDFASFDSQRTVLPSSETSQHYIKNQSHHSSESRGRWHCIESDKFEGRDTHIGLPKMSKNGRRSETRKAKSHLSLEKIHNEDVKTTGERSESVGDLLDRVRSSSEFSSSYEQLDSDSTLKASDSLDRQIGSSSSNVRLNASSRGSLTTSSRGSLAASSRGSLNASSRGSLQGSSGPEEEEDRKPKKFSFFRCSRRSSVPDDDKGASPSELRSTTLPRSTPAQILTTGTLPRIQFSQEAQNHPCHTVSERPSYHTAGPRSARYHPPGYRPPSGMASKRTFSTPTLQKEKHWLIAGESGVCVDDSLSVSSSILTNASSGGLSRGPRGNANITPPSPLGASFERTADHLRIESTGGSLASFENYLDEEEAEGRDSSDGTRLSFANLGPKSRSESLASVYSSGVDGRFGAVPIQGEILLSLLYSYKEGHLECHVEQCRDLAPVDSKRNRSDPYVKAYLLPDKSKSGKRKTKVKRHTVNPVFQEIFKFVSTLSELESKTLWLSVWHSDMFGRNVFLGEVVIPLTDAIFEDSSPRWHQLLDRLGVLEDANYGAYLIVAVKFVPADVLAAAPGSRRHKKSRGALQVRVKEASGLTGSRVLTLPDPICKGVLLPEKGKGSKQKTGVLRKTKNPKWNHTMTFDDVSLEELADRSLELTIWNYDRFGSSEFMGGCRLNLGKETIAEWFDASGLEQKLWEQLLEKPNLWVESSLLLRPNMDRPVYSSSFTD